MRFILKLQEWNLRWSESLLTAETEGTVRDEGFLAPAPSLPSEGPTQPNGGGGLPVPGGPPLSMWVPLLSDNSQGVSSSTNKDLNPDRA